METLYRKEQILNIVDRCFHMYASDYRNDARISATEMLEEIPDKPNRNTGSFLKPNQKEHADEVFEFLTKKTSGDTTKDCECDKLEADKSELLEALEKCNNELHFYSGHTHFVKENESLIQKHKQ